MWLPTSCGSACSCISRGANFKMMMMIIIIQVGVAVYGRYATLSSPPVSYLAHISGSVAGVTIGEVRFSYASSSTLQQQLVEWLFTKSPNS